MNEALMAKVVSEPHKPAKKRDWDEEAWFCWCCMKAWPCTSALMEYIEYLEGEKSE